MIAFLLMAAQQIDVPRTVNGDPLGAIADFQDRGPARICVGDGAIDLLPGETATLQYAGIHSASLAVTGDKGTIKLAFGNAWSPKHGGHTISSEAAQDVVRFRSGRAITYTIKAVTEYSSSRKVPIIFVTGSALHGNADDLPALSRIHAQARGSGSCHRRYAYGWDMVFGEEPLSMKAPR